MSFNKALAVQSNPSTYCSHKNQEVGSAHHYPALVIIQSCLWPDPNSPSLVNIVKCEPQCTVILPPIPPHQETKTRNKQREGKIIWPFLYSSLCATGMVALRTTEVEVKWLSLLSEACCCRTELRKSRLMTHLWVCLLTPCTVLSHLSSLMSSEDMAPMHMSSSPSPGGIWKAYSAGLQSVNWAFIYCIMIRYAWDKAKT